MKTLRLVLGDQLNPQHSWFARKDESTTYVLMEVRQETDYVLHHAQKILAIFAAMRRFANALRLAGHRVEYMRIDDEKNKHDIPANISWLLEHLGATHFEWQQPDEWRLDDQLTRFASALHERGVQVRRMDSEHFLTTRSDAATLFGDRRQWLMEHFYRHMRRTHRVLMDGDQPCGGRWNFDAENRKPWNGSPAEPEDRRPSHDHRALWCSIQAAGVRSFGQPCADALRWPIDRSEALEQLEHFVRDGLPHFGDHQDAMHTSTKRLFHSLLSFALNVKMLHPLEVIQRVEAEWRAGRAPLPAVEGFIRQILGWREYVRGVYWARMPGYEANNHFAHQRPLPPWFWNGQTRMNCLSRSIGQSLDTAYAHHIQRLMVIGNFALLAGLAPKAVHGWYLGVYIDAFEWVELPNTLGMSQYADGGLLATKPYVSSGAYIHRMSDYCKNCSYDQKRRTGSDACPFNALYWDFFERNADKLSGNHRLSMVYRQLGRFSAEERDSLRQYAKHLLANLESV